MRSVVNLLEDLTWIENDEISRAIYTIKFLSLMQRARSYGFTKSALIDKIVEEKSTDQKSAKLLLSKRVDHYVDSIYYSRDSFIEYIMYGVPPTHY